MSSLARCLTGCSVVLLCCPMVLATQSDAVVVENSKLRMVFVTRPEPRLQELVHKPSGTNLVAKTAQSGFFAINVRRRDGGSDWIDGQSAKHGTLRVTKLGGRQQMVIRYSGLGPADKLQVRIEGRLDGEEPIARWSIAVENPAHVLLAQVRFPCVSAVPAIGSPADDFLVVPAMPGLMIENPAQNWPATHQMGWAFPGEQSVQFLSFQDRSAGVYLASMDTASHRRQLAVHKKENKQLLLFHEYRLADESATEWRSPYDVALGVTAGTWQQTADIYKRWAIHQPWCRKTLAQRDDLPDWWRRGPCVYVCSVRTVDGTRHCTASFYPQLAENLRLFRAKIGGPVVPMLAAWENHRLWTAGDYFPAFDADRARTAISQIRQGGFHPFVFLSGLYYTYKNDGVDGSLVPGWERYLGSFVIDKQTGKPKTSVLSESNKTWNRYSYSFCPAAPGVKEFYRSVLDRLHALGVDVVQMDQAVSGTGDACYSDSHGHRPGPGLYQASSLHELLGDMRCHGRSLSPDFLLTNEEVHEELIPYVDGFHTREYKEHYWYRDVPGGRGIPLFTYLYHEYAIAYGGDSAGVNARKDANLVRQHAVNLVTGKTPGVAVWSNPRAIVDAHADQLKMVQNHSHLLKSEVQRFLMLGRMLHSLEFDVPSVTFRIPVARGEKWQAVPFVERAVLTSSWQSPEGLVGHCLVNVTDAKQPVRLRLDARGAADWPKADVDLYRAHAADACERVLKNVALPRKYEMELAPLEAVFFVLRPAHR